MPAARLAVLFGLFYLVQGIAEPSEGLVAQPVRSLLKSGGYDAAEIAGFVALVSLPWSIKPLYGLLTDFLPLFGYRRKGYLVLSAALTAGALLALYWLNPSRQIGWLLLALLVPAGIGTAFSDVVIDALMVERGQPHGLTGKLQSVQWTALYGGAALAGWLGGYLSQHRLERLGFLICGLFALGGLALAIGFVKESPSAANSARRPGLRSVLKLSRWQPLIATGLFLLLWEFNPFCSAVLYMHMTEPVGTVTPTGSLGFSEQFYGNLQALMAGAQMAASALYGLYCRRLPMRVLVHGSIVLGILSTLGYWLVTDEPSALIVTVLAGFGAATAIMVQLDLAAQACPAAAAGTCFALLMSLANLGNSLSTWLGGLWYQHWARQWGGQLAFETLVGVGAATTAACFLVTPWLATGAPPKMGE